MQYINIRTGNWNIGKGLQLAIAFISVNILSSSLCGYQTDSLHITFTWSFINSQLPLPKSVITKFVLTYTLKKQKEKANLKNLHLF